MYWVPVGLPSTTGASPANTSGRATRPMAKVKARMVGIRRSIRGDAGEVGSESNGTRRMCSTQRRKRALLECR